MTTNYWFKFEWNAWLADEALSGCSLEAQGLWLRCLCFMYRANVAELTGTIEQLRRKLGVLPEELTRCLHELKTNKAADVRFCNGDVSIISRRRKRELNIKERNRLYVSKHREKDECKTNVSIQSKSKSKNKSKKEERESGVSPLTHAIQDNENLQLYLDTFLPYCPPIFLQELICDRVTDAAAWADALAFWQTNAYRPQSVGKICDKYDEIVAAKTAKEKTERSSKFAVDLSALYT